MRHNAVANHGTPREAFVEPSTGSTITTGAAASPVTPLSSESTAIPAAREHLETGLVGSDIEGVLTMTMPRRPPVGRGGEHLGDSVGGSIEEVEHFMATVADMEPALIRTLTGRAHNEQR